LCPILLALCLLLSCSLLLLFFYSSRAPPALPSFPTRRSSDLGHRCPPTVGPARRCAYRRPSPGACPCDPVPPAGPGPAGGTGSRSEEHTSELQSRFDLVCRLLLEKKKSKS